MVISADTLKRMVPISLFNRGQANKVFERVKSEGQIVVLKNNAPEVVILSTNEYARMSEIVENYQLLMLAQKRLAAGGETSAVPFQLVLQEQGITQEEIDASEDVDFE